MELVVAAPADWLAAAAPVAGGAAPLLRSAEAEATADGAPAGFDWLLALLEAPPAGGQALPPSGNPLQFVPAAPLPPPVSAAPPPPALPSAVPGAVAWPAEAAPLPSAVESTPVAAPGGDDLPAPFTLSAAWRAAMAAQSIGATQAPAPAASEATPPTSSTPPAASLPLGPSAMAALAAPAQLPVVPRAVSTGVEPGEPPSAPPATAIDRGLASLNAATPPPARPVPFVAGADDVTTVRHGTAVSTPPPALAVAAPAVALPAAVVQATLRRDELAPAATSTTTPAVDGTLSLTAAPAPAALAAPASNQALPPPTHAGDHARGAPLDTRTPSWPETFANRLQWLVDHRVGEARIKLNPPELGAVDVKVSLVDDKTYVQLTAATAAARDELSQGLPRLRELFVASGIELGGASVQGGGDGRGNDGAGGYETAARAPAVEEFAGAGDGPPLLRAARPAAGRIDVFA